ncbi:hypothetical protein BG011_000553 [Mortierella polycephala]|uniref:Peroxiredoxin-like 2A n=1 Tax=Mortierella polycephala TaxID=41804 RepID=A0A9P6PM71_9FUNG|nr:hypothetical protein BG011_000553 [Mortierella polycephala]
MADTLTQHYNAIKDVILTDFLNKGVETTFKANELWSEKPTIVVVIRRPGCPFCREEAHILDEHRELIEKEMGIRMVVVLHEKLGAATFQKDYWNGGETYFDAAKGFYKALGGGALRWASLDQFIRPSMWFNTIRNLRSGVRGNLLVGEGRIFGGLYIVRKGDQGLAYKFEETVFGNLAPISEVLKVCSEISGVDLKEASIQLAKRQEEQALARQQAAAAAGQTECDEDVCSIPPPKL